MSTVTIRSKAHKQVIDITEDVAALAAGMSDGICSVFTQHTTCALTVLTNEEGIAEDLLSVLRGLVPQTTTCWGGGSMSSPFPRSPSWPDSQPSWPNACAATAVASSSIEEGLPRRLLAYALLNRYWGLDFMLQVADPERRCATFDDLERAVFPVGLA